MPAGKKAARKKAARKRAARKKTARKKAAARGFAAEKDEIEGALRAVLERHAAGLSEDQTHAGYTLVTSKPDKNGNPTWFGGVGARKSYVSYHLMPVYHDPGLLEGISPALKKRMQGKSCFNFKVLDEALFEELGELTGRCKRQWKKEGRL